ncbi:MAG: TonB-dependent siderophore receptor [Wenzhouxiangella sp.]|nr:TonB-dependent siderophore receptor [Wenzhouxiangella sp.]
MTPCLSPKMLARASVLRCGAGVLMGLGLMVGAGLAWADTDSASSEAGGDVIDERIDDRIDDQINDRVTVQQDQYLSVNEAQSVKTPTPIIDVPQSLTIMTAEEILARGFDSIGQIIDYTPGVNTSQGEGHRDAVVFRGVRSTADFFIDGNRDDVQYYRSLYNVEKVEILRGPNALLFGRGGTGGILNRVSKKARLDQAFVDYTAQLGEFGSYGATIDANLATGESSALRINAMAEYLDNHRDFYYGERFGFNPSIRYAPNTDTTVDLSYEYIDHDRFIDRGIPTSEGRPVEALKDLVLADPDNNYHTLQAHVVRANAEHLFNDALKGNVNVFYGDYDKVYANYYATDYDPASQVVELDGYIDGTVRENLIVSGNLISEFQTQTIEHTVILGAEFINTQSDQFRFNPVFSTSNADREDFIATRPLDFNNGSGTNAQGQPFSVAFTDFNDDTRVDLEVMSFYLQNEMALSDRFDLILGARFDEFDIEVFNADPGVMATQRRTDQEITPRGGFIFKPQENLSVYLSYSESFLPRSGEQYTDINGAKEALDPDTFTNREVGIKWDISNALALTAAYFENEQTSPQVADQDPQTLDIIDATIDGFELQLTGQLTDRLALTANYSQLDGEIVERSGPTGRTPAELPETTASMWAQWRPTDRLGLGFGVMHQGQSFINSANTAFLPSYTRFDAVLAYRVTDQHRLQLKFENLTDKLYFPNAHATHQASVGAPRHIMLQWMGSL